MKIDRRNEHRFLRIPQKIVYLAAAWKKTQAYGEIVCFQFTRVRTEFEIQQIMKFHHLHAYTHAPAQMSARNVSHTNICPE